MKLLDPMKQGGGCGWSSPSSKNSIHSEFFFISRTTQS